MKQEMKPAQFLEDLLSGDATRIWSASSGLLKCWDVDLIRELADHLPEIREKTSNVELGGIFHPNVAHLANALHRLEFVRDQKGCLCRLYGAGQFDNPSQEAERGNVKILETKFADGIYIDFYICECQHCKTRYQVGEREYHYTFWTWSAV